MLSCRPSPAMEPVLPPTTTWFQSHLVAMLNISAGFQNRLDLQEQYAALKRKLVLFPRIFQNIVGNNLSSDITFACLTIWRLLCSFIHAWTYLFDTWHLLNIFYFHLGPVHLGSSLGLDWNVSRPSLLVVIYEVGIFHVVPQVISDAETRSWKPVFAAVTMTELLLYDAVPSNCEEWTSTAIQRHAIIATR